MEAIVLAGGLGTRLRGVIGDAPKCMAPVNDQPFLSWLFRYLAAEGCTRVILSLGYLNEVVINWLADNPQPFEVDYVIELEPLGTGGGMALALAKAKGKDVLVLNGDTMLQVNLAGMLAFHTAQGAATTLALKPMSNFERYGVVNINANQQITSFEEKQYRDEGLINGGIYAINCEAFVQKNLPVKFSFEKDYLERFVAEGNFCGYVSNAYFIDIGIPADYTQAMTDFKTLFA